MQATEGEKKLKSCEKARWNEWHTDKNLSELIRPDGIVRNTILTTSLLSFTQQSNWSCRTTNLGSI